MGQIVKQVSEHTTVYYWYPGDKREWARAGLAVGVGAAGFAVVTLLGAAVLTAVVFGTSVTAALTGLNFGRRDARALAGFPDLGHRGARRAAVEHTGRAAWRAMAQGFGGAAAAVLIINLPAGGSPPTGSSRWCRRSSASWRTRLACCTSGCGSPRPPPARPRRRRCDGSARLGLELTGRLACARQSRNNRLSP